MHTHTGSMMYKEETGELRDVRRPGVAQQSGTTSCWSFYQEGVSSSEGKVNNNRRVSLSCLRAGQLCLGGGRGGEGVTGEEATSALHAMWGECESACCHGNKAAPQSPLREMEATWVWPCGGVAWHAERDYWSQRISERRGRQQWMYAAGDADLASPSVLLTAVAALRPRRLIARCIPLTANRALAPALITLEQEWSAAWTLKWPSLPKKRKEKRGRKIKGWCTVLNKCE